MLNAKQPPLQRRIYLRDWEMFTDGQGTVLKFYSRYNKSRSLTSFLTLSWKL